MTLDSVFEGRDGETLEILREIALAAHGKTLEQAFELRQCCCCGENVELESLEDDAIAEKYKRFVLCEACQLAVLPTL